MRSQAPEEVEPVSTFPPALPESRLNRLGARSALDLATARRVTLVVGPFGSGKTTLLGDWFGDLRVAKSWTSFGQGSVSAQQLISALSRSLVADDRLERPQGVAPEETTQKRANRLMDLLAATSGEVISVIDDYHVIESDETNQLMRSLFNMMPHNWHFVIATESLPNLGLGRLNVEMSLSTIDYDTLAFSPAETLALLRQLLDNEVSSAEAFALSQTTAGWIKGIELAAESARRSDLRALKQFSGRHPSVVAMAEQQLERLAPEDKTVILATALLPRIDAELCELATRDLRAWSHLNDLADKYSFLFREGRERVEFHPVFREAFVAAMTPNDITGSIQIRARAHELLIEQGSVADSIDLEVGDVNERAAVRIIENADFVTDCVTNRDWYRWIRSLTESSDGMPLRLSLMNIYRSVEAGLDDIMDELRAARSRIRDVSDPDEADALALAADWLELRSLLNQAEIAQAGKLASRIGEWIRSSPPRNTGPWKGLNRAAATVGRALWLDGNPEGAKEVLTNLVNPDSSFGARSEGYGLLSLIELMDTNLTAARKAAHLSVDARGHGGERLPCASPYSKLASLMCASEFDPPVGLRLCESGISTRVSDLGVLELLIDAEQAIRSSRQDKANTIHQSARVLCSSVSSNQLSALVEAAIARANSNTVRGVETLSHRELEVLELLPGSLTRHEIAQHLYISPNTVKTHIRNLYAKLGVSSRHEAVRRAVELGLLSNG